MTHDKPNNPCFFDHTCPDSEPCPNVRPLPGIPPVLTVAEQKLKEINEIVLDFEGSTFNDLEEANDEADATLKEIRKILDR